MRARVAQFSSQRRRSRFRLPSPVCLRLALAQASSRPMISQNSPMSFDSLGLAEPLLRAVHEAGYTTPTPIQAQAIPAVLSGGDVMGGAQTGTGKTAGFVLPLLQRLMMKPAVRDARGKLPIRALILTPTRELAAQVEESVRVYGKHSQLSEVARRNQTADLVAQKVHPVGREMKKDLLTHLVKENDWHQVLVFTRMKHGANRLVEHLEKQGITAMAIHGNKSQTARTKALADFKKGEPQVLVATDIAARGIDIDQLPHVVNFEMPNVPEDYVHRIGRTGRAGAQGEAISLVCVDEDGFLRDIERLTKNEIPKEIVPGFEPPAHERPEPIVLGRMVIGEGAGRGGARPRRDGPGRADSGRSSHGNGGGASRSNGGGAGRSHSGGGGNGSSSSANANGHRGGGSAGRSGGGNADRGGSAPRRDGTRP